MKAFLSLTLVLALALAGCASTSSSSGTDSETGGSGAGGSSSTGTSGSSGTSTGASGNRAPVISVFTVNKTTGVAPLKVLFKLNASDADKDGLTYKLVFGDGTTNSTGSLPAGNVTHTFSAKGNFTAKLFVSDGKATVNNTLLVKVGAAVIAPTGPLPEDQAFSGTLNGLPWIAGFGSLNEGGDAEATHTFTMTGAASKMTITLTYDADPTGDPLDYGSVDLDFFVTDPSGKETASEAAGPEPPLVVANPAAGSWSIRVYDFSSLGDVDYDLTVHFE